MDPEKKPNSEVTVDDILQILGPFGKFNIFNFVLILFPVFLAGMYSSVYNFEAMDMNYRWVKMLIILVLASYLGV